jgi:hypothetical protein
MTIRTTPIALGPKNGISIKASAIGINNTNRAIRKGHFSIFEPFRFTLRQISNTELLLGAGD